MFFKQIDAGGDRNFSYLVADEETGEAAVVDPGSPPKTEQEIIGRNGYTLRYIINTHDHFDHTGGNRELVMKTGARVAMFSGARSPKDIGLDDGTTLSLGSLELSVIHTPGHTPDSICILAGNHLVTGDTLFVGKVGGTGFGEDARNEYDSLHGKLMSLPDDVTVWPGHDYGTEPSSTIGRERATNPFLLRDSFESFVDLKKNWSAYKREHNIT